MENKQEPNMDRRAFLKRMGLGLAASSAVLTACKGGKTAGRSAADGAATGDMTYRTQRRTGDKVSLLGYGCMRWPLRTRPDGEEEIDQDAVNELIDYAMAHGVTYYDTSPAYVRGL